MAFYLAQAAKACKNPAARSVYSASALLRLSASANRIPTAFSKLTASHNYTPTLSSTLNFARYNSSAALARKPQESAVSGDSGDAALSFDSLKGVISDPVLRAITGPMGISNLSAVQKEVLPLLPDLARPYSPDELESSLPRDLLVKAKTGTGKTLAFLVPAIEKRLQEIERHVEQAANDVGKAEDARFKKDVRYQYTKDTVGTVILSPTRELAGQIGKEALKLTAGIDRGSFGVQVLIGGEDKRYQMRQFKGGRRDIVVATPGRMRDLLDSEPEFRRAVETAQLLILDEADTLLDMGFRSDIESIASELPPSPQRQTFLFSATVSQQIRQIARATLHKKHKFINCVAADDSPVHHHVPQYHTVCPSPAEQLPHILRLIAHDQLVNPGASKVIVFLPTTRWTQMFATILTELKDRILPAGRSTTMYEIHSKKDQDRRTRVSERFRQDKTGASILVTSDVSARGVDYPGVTRVIQVGISSSGDHYVHRVGRTGRGSSTLNGRGDLVLLDWESGFAKPGGPLAELGVPLKGVTVNALKEEVETLAKKFDEDPQGFFPESVAAEPERRGKLSLSGRSRESRQTTSKGPIGPRQFQKSMTEALSSESIDGAIKELHGMLDSQDVNDVFASNLGYYLGKFEELNLRGSKEEVIEGLKDWTMEAFGLEKRPYVSDALLLRMGVKGDSHRRGGGGGSFGMRRSGGYGSSDRGGDRFESRSRSVGDRSFNRDRSSTWGGERSFDRPRSNSVGSFGGRSSFDGGRSRDSGERKSQAHWMGRGRSNGKSRSQNDFY